MVWGDERMPSQLLPLGEEQGCTSVSSGSVLLGEIAAVLLPVLLGKASTEGLVLDQAALRR